MSGGGLLMIIFESNRQYVSYWANEPPSKEYHYNCQGDKAQLFVVRGASPVIRSLIIGVALLSLAEARPMCASGAELMLAAHSQLELLNDERCR